MQGSEITEGEATGRAPYEFAQNITVHCLLTCHIVSLSVFLSLCPFLSLCLCSPLSYLSISSVPYGLVSLSRFPSLVNFPVA
ncbi:hypothetical protein A0H81_00589 [Grifola frondosa]|uniref:Uncharacterized protein n=1 Tax=Grifola frondosa TaxID=5627 RepID=A0A1C7MRN2_GRIFR|nr:hypothetical protein A0H81_00589 [Grifola frondosa]